MSPSPAVTGRWQEARIWGGKWWVWHTGRVLGAVVLGWGCWALQSMGHPWVGRARMAAGGERGLGVGMGSWGRDGVLGRGKGVWEWSRGSQPPNLMLFSPS